MLSLYGKRKTIAEIRREMEYTFNIKVDIYREASCELKGGDFLYMVCLGMVGCHYLDYEIFMLKTRAKRNKKRVFLITGISIL
jgi:hypothetical protein